MRRNVRLALGVPLVLALVVPVGVLIVSSVSLRWYYPALLPQELSLRAWQALFAPESQLWRAVQGSVTVAGLTAVLATLIALPAARQLAREGRRLRLLIGGLLLAPLVLPVFASVMGVQVAFLWLGLADTPAGVILVHLLPATPYAVVLLTGSFERYDPRYEELARTLGVRGSQMLWCVTLPLLLPGVLVAALLAFLVSWSEYLLTLIVGGGQIMTLPLLLFASAQGGDDALTAALSLVYLAPAALVFATVAARLRGWRA